LMAPTVAGMEAGSMMMGTVQGGGSSPHLEDGEVEFWDLSEVPVARGNEMSKKEALRKARKKGLISGKEGAFGGVDQLKAALEARMEPDRVTPLILAAREGREEDVLLLLNAHADLAARDAGNRTAIENASRNAHGKIVLLLGQEEARKKGLFRKDINERFKMELYKDGPKVERTPLMRQAADGHLQNVQLLLKGGARIMDTNKHGASCLYVACQAGHLKVVRFLAERGGLALLLLKNTDMGATCLYSAAENGHLAVVRFCCEAGGPELLYQAAKNGTSCLWIAAARGHTEVVQYLAKQGGQQLIEMVETKHGASCLYAAAENGHLDAVKMLCAMGGRDLVDIKSKDSGWLWSNNTPLAIAKKKGHVHVVAFLKSIEPPKQ